MIFVSTKVHNNKISHFFHILFIVTHHLFILYYHNITALTPKQKELQSKLSQLTLNSTAIWEREKSRGEIIAPLIIKVPYYVLCYLLDVVFEGKYVFSRFFLLETVARMPYFSYIAMLHLYETLGFWRRSKGETKKKR